MKGYQFIIIAVIFTMVSCADKTPIVKPVSEKEWPAFDFGTWITAKKGKSDKAYVAEFEKYQKYGIDEVYPMIYHGFYNEETDWIGYATKQGVTDLKSKSVGLNTGVYMPSFKSAEELKEAILLAKENGAKGITFFDGNNLSKEYLEAIKETKSKI